MKILFLHGWQSVVGGVKPTYLQTHGHTVFNPALPDDDFAEAVRIAEAVWAEHRPDVVVGSSRGGAVALNMQSEHTPLVLLCPAWKRWGTVDCVHKPTIVLHSRGDDVIPFAESEQLVRNSEPHARLIEVGTDHRLAEPEPLAAMLQGCEELGN
jgi:esterase/lipase